MQTSKRLHRFFFTTYTLLFPILLTFFDFFIKNHQKGCIIQPFILSLSGQSVRDNRNF